MKSLFVALVLALSPLALAQEPTDAADLAVTAEQKKEIRKLMREGAKRDEAQAQVLSEAQIAALSSAKAKQKRKDTAGRLVDELDLTDEQRQEIESIRAAGGTRKDVHAVLTEGQRTRLKEMKRERRGKDKGKHGGEHRGGGKDKDAEPMEEAPAEEAPPAETTD